MVTPGAKGVGGMPKILVAPGSGDIHWVMLKMQGFIERVLNGVTPEIWVWSENASKDRAQGFIERIPFVKWGGYFRAEKFKPDGINMFVHGNPYLRLDFQDFDYFMAFNRPLEDGKDLERDIMPKVPVNWNYPIQLHLEDMDYAMNMQEKVKGRGYIVCAFFGHSFYSKWLKTYGPNKIRGLLKKIVGRTYYTPLLIGREWDKPFMETLWVPGCADITGNTEMGQMLALCQKARAFIGFAAGNGMLASHLGTKTYMLWGPHFKSPNFQLNWVHPLRRHTSYKPLDIQSECADYIVGEIINEDRLLADSQTQRDVVPPEDVPDGGIPGCEPGPDVVQR